MHNFYNFTHLSRLNISWINEFHALRYIVHEVSVTSQHLKNLHLALLFVKSNSMSTNFLSLFSYTWNLLCALLHKKSQIIHTYYTNNYSMLDHLDHTSYQNRTRFPLDMSLVKKTPPLLMNLWRFTSARKRKRKSPCLHTVKEAWHMRCGCTRWEAKRIFNQSGNPQCMMNFQDFGEEATLRTQMWRHFVNIRTYILHTYMNASPFSKLREKLQVIWMTRSRGYAGRHAKQTCW